MIREQISEQPESGKSDKCCKCNTALSCRESNCTARCATVTEPSHRVNDWVLFPFLFWKNALYIEVSISNRYYFHIKCVFSLLSLCIQKNKPKSYTSGFLCVHVKICLQMHSTWLSQACLKVKSGSLPQLHSLLQIHANLQSSVIWAKTYVNCCARGVESISD